jgi:2-polyprenyl-3-methyl-5-hydroxy-6-metoxy-1,4-benzoquinol methylase
MKVKEHYDKHLGNFYSWMLGDFQQKQLEQQQIFELLGIKPRSNKIAIDLGAGNGLQSIALANLGFAVKSIDFNKRLLSELDANKGEHAIEIIEADLVEFMNQYDNHAELIICMGDTISHLPNTSQLEELISKVSSQLSAAGRFIVSFRDLNHELLAEQRFIPVKSDDHKILTCFVEFFVDHVMIYDILHEKENEMWVQKISCYPKLRLSEPLLTELLKKNSFSIKSSTVVNKMIYLVGEKI